MFSTFSGILIFILINSSFEIPLSNILIKINTTSFGTIHNKFIFSHSKEKSSVNPKRHRSYNIPVYFSLKNVLNVFSLIYEFFTFLFHDKNITFRAFGI